jgi:hypothetical protein
MKPYEMQIGPEGFLAPSVSTLGVIGADPGFGLHLGQQVPMEKAIEEAATSRLGEYRDRRGTR